MYYLLKYNSLNSVVLVQGVKRLVLENLHRQLHFLWKIFIMKYLKHKFQKTDRGVSACIHHSGSIFLALKYII